MGLNRDDILGADDAGVEVVDVPEWGGAVCLRVLTGKARDAFERACQKAVKADNLVGLKARLLRMSVCDASGGLLFSAEDEEALNSKSGAVLDRLAQRAQQLNRLTDQSIEELAGNSAGDRSDDSGSS